MSENFTKQAEEEEEGEGGGSVRDITSKAVRQTVEENEDLKRQNILRCTIVSERCNQYCASAHVCKVWAAAPLHF